MSDEQTMKDHIEDLMIEQASLIQQLREQQRQNKMLRTIADKAFTFAGNKCLTDCRGACMCTCGYEHWHALQRSEKN